ncbi:ABC transporter ATP-binding protein [Anaerocolumna xylanovorans]|uniref:ABC-type multidrug transport system, ATPase and permease component n=1 Tax=Anaerocolumna xylanovorans DSM 12503 TaxID=1121345 RepID=A0A1M7XZD5_9FIRM|nr:ABC transporter ATP-binding protein [Anaerocolumna xylanovorans]SHO44329.1 ABC-type multidrug transport system, ATPase and permease component [Anaerocolumna xylanovorans DSM 12503]
MNIYKKQFYVKNKLNFCFTIISCVLMTAINVASAFILKLIMDVATSGSLKDMKRLFLYSMVYLIVLIAVMFIKRRYYNNFIKKAMVQFKEFAFSKLLDKSINSFDKEVTGRYISIFTNDMASIETGYVEANLKITVQIMSFLCGLAAMAYFNLILTLAVLAASFLPILVSVIFGKSLEEKVRLVSAKNEGFVSMVKDLLTGFSVVKSFRAEKEIFNLYQKENAQIENAKNGKRKTGDFITLLSASSSFLVELTTFLLGAYLAIQNIITAGTVIAFIQLLNLVLGPVEALGPMLTERKAAVSLINKIETATTAAEKKEVSEEKTDFSHAITLHDVSFGYEKEQSILKSVNLTFEKGKSYVIVGASGSGKSTLVNLLLGYHNNFDGEIKIDGIDLMTLPTSSLYNMFSVIQQNVFLFDSTIQDNITMFKTFEKADVTQAMEKSGLTKLAAEKGVNYKCGENGSFLSGGEKQRISIARSLLRKTPVLIMDEATSALDLKTARLVEEEINKLKDITRIVISHRMDEGNLRLYDRIIVLNNGIVAEEGEFDRLIENKGYFYSLFQVTKSA